MLIMSILHSSLTPNLFGITGTTESHLTNQSINQSVTVVTKLFCLNICYLKKTNINIIKTMWDKTRVIIK